MSEDDRPQRACVECGRMMPFDDEEAGEIIAHARTSRHGGNYSVLCEDSRRVTTTRMKRLGILTNVERMAALSEDRS